MASITRAAFGRALDNGVDLSDPGLADGLEGTGVTLPELRGADLDGDGVLSGKKELDRAFSVVDGIDDDRNRRTFDGDGDAGAVYRALRAAVRPPPDGAVIAQAARDRVASDGPDYAIDKAPTSPLAHLSGNTKPGETQPAWLENRNKCNQFVGDALTQAGVAAPTVSMANGSLHYARAETWPSYHQLFDRVTDPKDIRPGDVLVRDYAGPPGENGGHIEVVTGTGPLKTTGAHETGASETNNNWLLGATYNPATRSFTDTGGDEVYVLRPKRHAQD